MANVQNTAGPNETSKKLENERKNRLAQAAGIGKKEESEETKETQNNTEGQENPENEEKSGKKLDNDQNNAYINNDTDNDSKESSNEDKPKGESEEEKYKRIFEKQFGKDGVKAAKSWAQTQRSYVELRDKLKEHEQVTQSLEQVIDKNPKLGELIKTAHEKGELSDDDLQSFLKSDREPNEQGKPNTSSNESKLEIVDEELDLDSVNEETLAQEGLLDLSKKELLTDSEWELARRQAALKYADKTMPDRIAKKAYKRFEQQIEDKRKQEEQERQKQKLDELNKKRYRKGIETVIEKFNLDFAGNEDHQKALDEIERRASYIRDPENPNAIRENAVYLATVELMEEGVIDADKADNVDEKAQQAKQSAEADLSDKMGFNKSASSSKNTQGNPDSLESKLRQRRYQEYEDEIENRRKTDRLHKKSTN